MTEDYSKPLKSYEKILVKETLIKILKTKAPINRAQIRKHSSLGDYRLLRRLTVQGFLTQHKAFVHSYYELTPEGIAEFQLMKYI